MKKQKKFLGYVLVDPTTNQPRYVGITTQTLKMRLKGHLQDIKHRPDLNKHKTAWILKLQEVNLQPIIKLVIECNSLEELKKWEQDYIKQYKDTYKLINQTIGGDWVGFNTHSRESILKKHSTRSVIQYNVLGEKIDEFEMMEDIARKYNLRSKACSHITQCCKHTRTCAYGYLWRYKGDSTPLPKVNIYDISFNTIYQYKDGIKVGEFSSYVQASLAIGDKSHGANIKSCCMGDQCTCKGYSFKLVPKFIYYSKELLESAYINYKKHSFTRKSYIKVGQYDLNNNLIKVFNTLSEAGKSLGIKSARRYIKQCCEDKIKTYHNFIWKFA